MPSDHTGWRFRLRGLMLLAAALSFLALLAVTAGITLLNIGHDGDTPTEAGKWSLQLATVLAGTGAISAILRQTEISRAKRETWTGLLQDVIAAHDTVHVANRLISAHATVKTYGEQVKKLIEVRETLRRITASPDLHDEPRLRRALADMRGYLDHLVLEYQREYLAVARQQALDEAVLSNRLRQLAETESTPVLPDELAKPLPAWLILEDENRFPLLSAFRKDYENSAFRAGYERAKPLLERKAGIHRRADGGIGTPGPPPGASGG